MSLSIFRVLVGISCWTPWRLMYYLPVLVLHFPVKKLVSCCVDFFPLTMLYATISILYPISHDCRHSQWPCIEFSKPKMSWAFIIFGLNDHGFVGVLKCTFWWWVQSFLLVHLKSSKHPTDDVGWGFFVLGGLGWTKKSCTPPPSKGGVWYLYPT